MKRLSNIEFIPVIALLPVDLGENYPYPSTIEQRYQHWKKVLKRFEIEHLEPIEKGYDYVEMKQIDDKAFVKLILMALNGIEEMDKENTGIGVDLPTSFEGGIVMKVDGKIFLTPQCCVSLHDYKEWFQLRDDKDFGMIWIGHPWICYLKKEHNVLLTGLVEKDFYKEEWRFYHANKNNDLTTFQYSKDRNKNVVRPSDFRYIISKSELENALKQLEQDIQKLKNRMNDLVQKLGFQQPNVIAQCLIDDNGSLLSYDQEYKEMVYKNE